MDYHRYTFAIRLDGNDLPDANGGPKGKGKRLCRGQSSNRSFHAKNSLSPLVAQFGRNHSDLGPIFRFQPHTRLDFARLPRFRVAREIRDLGSIASRWPGQFIISLVGHLVFHGAGRVADPDNLRRRSRARGIRPEEIQLLSLI